MAVEQLRKNLLFQSFVGAFQRVLIVSQPLVAARRLRPPLENAVRHSQGISEASAGREQKQSGGRVIIS